MKYPAFIIKLAGGYYTDARGVVFAILRAAGLNHSAAYTHAYLNTDLKEDQREERARKAEENEYMRQLINALKAAKRVPIVTTTNEEDNTQKRKKKEEEEKDGKVLRSFAEVREALAAVASDVEGKDKAGVLVQLAKMMPEERREEADRVVLYLPFNSDCRQCELFVKAKKQAPE